MEIVGNGTIKEVKPGKVYRLRHCLGKDPKTGKYRKSPWRTVYCTKRQARDELAKYKQELLAASQEKSRPAKPEVPTIAEYAQRYIDVRRTNKKLAATTISRNVCDAKHVVRLFGDYKLDELTPGIINSRCSAYRLAEEQSLNVLNRISSFR